MPGNVEWQEFWVHAEVPIGVGATGRPFAANRPGGDAAVRRRLVAAGVELRNRKEAALEHHARRP